MKEKVGELRIRDYFEATALLFPVVPLDDGDFVVARLYLPMMTSSSVTILRHVQRVLGGENIQDEISMEVDGPRVQITNNGDESRAVGGIVWRAVTTIEEASHEEGAMLRFGSNTRHWISNGHAWVLAG